MSKPNNSDSSSSESEIGPCSSKFDPVKALYSKDVKVPVKSAPLFENIEQYENVLKEDSNIIPIGCSELVKQREEEKQRLKLEEEKRIQEINKRRFEKYQGMVATTRKFRQKNVLTRIETMDGPLAALKDCVDHRLRIKVVTRSEKGIRGSLHGTLVAFDRQWNLALADVLEIWRRKGPNKRKVPPALGEPVPKGSAAKVSPVPEVTERALGRGIWECTRHVPQLMVRGEHVVLINVLGR